MMAQKRDLVTWSGAGPMQSMVATAIDDSDTRTSDRRTQSPFLPGLVLVARHVRCPCTRRPPLSGVTIFDAAPGQPTFDRQMVQDDRQGPSELRIV
jgi:hypothetical protein